MNGAPVKPVSTAFYLTSYLGGMFLGFIILFMAVAGIAGGTAAAEEGNDAGVVFAGIGSVLMFVAMALLLYGFIVLLILYYKMWDAIQDGYARTTPGKAIGFLFIPFFNIYWIFQAIWGYSKDYNSYIQRNRISASPLPESLFLIFCILSLTTKIPYIGAMLGIASLIIQIIMIVKICGAINVLALAPASVPVAEAELTPEQQWRSM